MKVRARHQLLQMTIGTFPEEGETYKLGTILMILLPIGLLFLYFLEWGLFLIYNEKMHPWKAIFVTEQEDDYSQDSVDMVSLNTNGNSDCLENIDIRNIQQMTEMDNTSVSDKSFIIGTSVHDPEATQELEEQLALEEIEECTKL
jgi:hypothetical protein